MTKTTVDVAEKDVEITELASIEPTRVDGVGTPANGFPILMMKSIAAPAAAAEKTAAGCGCCDACTCDHDTAKAVSADQRREYADSGVAMPTGDFPIPDEGHLKSAIGHWGGYTGDKAAAKKHIIKRAKKLGLTSLLPDGWEPKASKKAKAGTQTTKSATMPEGDPNTSAKAADITPDVIAKAVAEANAPFQAELTTLREQLAKVLNTPIPGGPQLVTPQTLRTAPSPAIEKAERLRAIANQTSDPETRASYLALAAREEGAPIAKE